MNCRAVLPNCSNSSISPFPRTTRLASTAGGCHQRWMPAAVQGKSWPGRLCESRLTSRPRAAMGDFGAVGKLPETKSSFYEILEIPAIGSHDDIKRAYKNLARKYHPDISPSDRTEEYTRRFIDVKEAYETLSDPGHRALYDRYLARGLHLASFTRRHFDEEMDDKSGWKNRWEDQLGELNRRSMTKNSDENLSWGARMRRLRAES